jgi:hypothetical protein
MPPSDAPLFVVGCGRSGTTILRLMLDAGPDIAIPGESHFIPKLWREHGGARWDRSPDPVGLARATVATPQFRRWEVPEGPIVAWAASHPEASFADVIEAVFVAYAAARGKSRWGDKTPQYVRTIDLLARLFPSSRFVHLIRDGRDVALSYLSFEWGPSSIWHAAQRWRTDVLAGRRSGSRLAGDRYLEVHYEALVDDPCTVLQRICSFADLRFDPAMLLHHVDAAERVQSRSDRLTQHAAATRPLTTGLRDWRRQMAARDVRAFEAVAGTALSASGYERRFPVVPASVRAEAWLRMGVLEARISAGHLPGRAGDAFRPKGMAGPAGDRSEGSTPRRTRPTEP